MSYARFAPHRLFARSSPRAFRRWIRFFPALRHTGAKVRHISDDWRAWDVELPLGLKTYNYVGTHFGGTLYSAADPWLMLAWMRIVPEAVVWDKAATVRFRRPGRTKLSMEVRITDDEIADVRATLATGKKFDRTWSLAWRDADGEVVAEVEKVVHFRPRSPKGLTET